MVRGARVTSGTLACALRNRRDTSKLMRLVWLFDLNAPSAFAAASLELRIPGRQANAMSSLTPSAQTRRRAVRLWLLAVAALMFATLVVGGTTRLTGSGLSIVEWKPVTGVLPPLDAPAWQAEFEKYKMIPQYR